MPPDKSRFPGRPYSHISQSLILEIINGLDTTFLCSWPIVAASPTARPPHKRPHVASVHCSLAAPTRVPRSACCWPKALISRAVQPTRDQRQHRNTSAVRLLVDVAAASCTPSVAVCYRLFRLQTEHATCMGSISSVGTHTGGWSTLATFTFEIEQPLPRHFDGPNPSSSAVVACALEQRP